MQVLDERDLSQVGAQYLNFYAIFFLSYLVAQVVYIFFLVIFFIQ